MQSENSARSGRAPVNWADYARDARDFLLTVSHAGPTAARVWTKAWCQWAVCVADYQDQTARQWTEIIREPGRGMDTLETMRQDHKAYLAKIAGIPELAVLEFAERMEEAAGSPGPASPSKGVPRPGETLVDVAEGLEAAAMDLLSEVRGEVESEHYPGTRGGPPSGQDPRVERLEKILAEVKAAIDKLKTSPDQSAR